MKALTFIWIICTAFCLDAAAQNNTNTFSLYHPEADALKEINEACAQAKKEGKHVFVQVGGNWCKWCRIFYNWSQNSPVIDSLINADYIELHVNYSKENKNPEAMKQLENPQRFGFPVFVILDADGKRIHTQNTAYLEHENGYSEKAVEEFLRQWNARSVTGEDYRRKGIGD